MYRILMVDDEYEAIQLRADFLREKNCIVDMTDDAAEALVMLSQDRYDAILLDVIMPDFGGLDLCREVRYLSDAPIIFISCMDDPESQIRGFSAGASDYIPKDCPLELFWVKIQTRIRMSKNAANDFILSFPPLKIDLKLHKVTLDEMSISLTGAEFNLLVILAENPGVVCSISDLYQKLWNGGYGEEPDSQVIQNHISRMRRKLQKAFPRHDFIETVWRKGYKFVPNVDE